MTNLKFIFDYCNYPLLPIKFFYKDKKTPIIEGLLDSGGDFIVIPLPIAKYLGVKLNKAYDVDTAGGTTQLYKAKLDMSIVTKDQTSKNTYYRNKEIHISTRDDIPVLLGRNPLFEDYEITFKKQKNQLILKIAGD